MRRRRGDGFAGLSVAAAIQGEPGFPDALARLLRKVRVCGSVLGNMTVIEVTDATFLNDVVERSKEVPVVVDFWAAWCGPCRALTPVLHKLADEADGAWELATIDVDQNPVVSQGFRIQGIPAVRAFKDGEMVAQFNGALPESHVRDWLQNLVPAPDVDTTELEAKMDELLRLVATGDQQQKDGARSELLTLLEPLPTDHPLAIDVRRALSRALF